MELAAYLLFPFKKKNKLPVTGPPKTTTVNISLCSLPGCIFHVNTHSYIQLQSNCLAASREPALLLNVATGGKRAKTWSLQGQQLVWGVNDHEKGSQVRGKTKLPWDTVRWAPSFKGTVAVPRVPLASSSPELTLTALLRHRAGVGGGWPAAGASRMGNHETSYRKDSEFFGRKTLYI